MFPDIMAKTVNLCLQISIMLGDALYFDRKIYSITEKYGIKPYFLPRTDATFHAGGVESWKMMLYIFMDNTQEWLKKYHMRSISESVNPMMNRKMPVKTRRKLSQRRQKRPLRSTCII